MPTPTDHAAAENLRAAASARDDATGLYLLDADTLDDVARLYGLDAETVDTLRDLMTMDEALLGPLATAGTMPDADCASMHNRSPAKIAAIRAAFHIPTYVEWTMHQRMTPPPTPIAPPPGWSTR